MYTTRVNVNRLVEYKRTYFEKLSVGTEAFRAVKPYGTVTKAFTRKNKCLYSQNESP